MALREAWNDDAVWFPGHMLAGTITHNAGPVWAEAGYEVYPSWIDAETPMPFNQVHGHASAYRWDEQAWRCDRRVRRHAVADETLRHVTFTLGERRIVGVDPDHGIDPSPLHGPLLLGPGTVLRG